MLPPGHIAGGYLAAYGLLKILKPELPDFQIQQLLVAGAVFGFIPDMDTFFSFYREKAAVVLSEKSNHRAFPTHAPLLWALACLCGYLFAQTEFSRLLALVALVSSGSHFILDSILYGIRWFWPFSGRFFAIKNAGIYPDHPTKTSFFAYWTEFVRAYFTEYRIVSYPEIALVVFTAWFVLVR